MTTTLHSPLLPPPPLVDEAPARRAPRDQTAGRGGELAALGEALPPPRAGGAGAALQSLAALELQRDELARRAAARRQELDAQGARQELARRAREEMLLEPRRYRRARVTNADVGEPGCRDWHVRPRFGLLGMLAGWWRVVISSGCPLSGRLAGAHRLVRTGSHTARSILFGHDQLSQPRRPGP